MTIGGFRAERIAEEIRNEVSLMLAGELKDPRLALPLSVTEVRVAPGMRAVRVFVELQGDDAEARTKALAGLKAAVGFVRHELVERLRLRRAPEIIFIADESEGSTASISTIYCEKSTTRRNRSGLPPRISPARIRRYDRDRNVANPTTSSAQWNPRGG